MKIVFPSIEAWDGNVNCVSFRAEVDGKRVRCLITWEALQDNFGGDSAPPLDCFRAGRHAIESKAENLLTQQRFEADGSILIQTQDGT